MKRVICLLLLLLLGLAGCVPVRPDGTPITFATQPATHEWDDLDLNPELRKALDAESSSLIWSVPESFRPEGAVSVRSYTALDCAELWPDLQAALFPEAVLREDSQDGGRRVLNYETENRSFTVWTTDSYVVLKDFSPEEARPLLDGIKAYLEREFDLSLELWNGPAPEEELAAYGIVTDAVPMYVRTDAPFTVSCLFENPEGNITLLNPLLPGEVMETVDLGEGMTAEELKSAADSAWIKQIPMAAEITDCTLVYYIDAEGQTLRPAWSLTGAGYAFDTGKMSQVELVLDALTGEAKRVR